MINILQIKKATVLVALTALPFLGQAQEIKVEGGNVKVKTAGTVIETKNGNVRVNTNAVGKGSQYQTKGGVKNILGNDLKQTITCNGEDVVITGNENIIVIKGYVRTLKLTGNDNEIKLEKVISIKTLGSDNAVVYKTSPNTNGIASINTTGSDNKISKQ